MRRSIFTGLFCRSLFIFLGLNCWSPFIFMAATRVLQRETRMSCGGSVSSLTLPLASESTAATRNCHSRVSLQHMYGHVLQCVCCSVLQCVCCSALQCVCCSVLQRETRVWCGGSASSLTLPLASQPTTYIWSCVVVCVLQCVAV